MARPKLTDESERIVQRWVAIPRWLSEKIESNKDFNLHKWATHNLTQYFARKEEILNA